MHCMSIVCTFYLHLCDNTKGKGYSVKYLMQISKPFNNLNSHFVAFVDTVSIFAYVYLNLQ